ncbi:TonB-dependent receptor [Methylophaga nitratireducenticrescens]|uniref:Protochlamydia outer membrane protein domain-containing protein n=1 Tax=Methylophaga nitratireducenticrescens TaxID=754476 RepID=I1XJ09_METNJ|nr:TonB-dependent receptor [Methylophaga nitratireducenticrescens]AFI84378.1 TonB-dependent receptor [Methylophaga nitratireducenticrescens]
MHAKSIVLLSGLGLLAFPLSTLLAAPVLQMHVYEAVPDQLPAANKLVGQAVEPQRLRLHIYESPQKTAEKKTPWLEYDKADIYFKAGYRRDELRWSIAGPGGQPNILSELTWKDIEIATVNLGATLYTKENWLVNLDFLYGEIYDGKNQDSDYFGNNRTREFSRSNNGADEGSVMDLSVGFGKRFEWVLNERARTRYEWRPMAGLYYYSQDLKIVDGFQTIPALGPFPGLDSSYDATWYGPWIGMENLFIKQDAFELGLNFKYHYAFYDATAQWNLRSDFAQPESFTHEAEGDGFVTELTGAWHLSPRLALTVDVRYQKWLADRNGEDKVYFANGNTAKLKFNEAEWESFGINLGLNYDF